MVDLQGVLSKIPKNVILIGVTKYSNKEQIAQAISQGLENIGENRVDSIEKIKDFSVKKHFIGNVQSNKIREIVENFDVIQSIIKAEHIKKIDLISKELNKRIVVLLQLKISSDENKQGIDEGKIESFLDLGLNLENVNIIGFMMMASRTHDKKLIRAEFRKTKILFDKYKDKYNLKYLSMGMSNDFLIAIEEGSNMVRIGSAIFK